MSATIISFPDRRPPAPAFGDWLCDRLGCHKWYVVNRRDYRGWRGIPWQPGTRLLLRREYAAFEREYEARFGVRR